MPLFQVIQTDSLYVSIGDHNVSKKDRYERIIKADKVFIHRNFQASNFENDIGMPTNLRA